MYKFSASVYLLASKGTLKAIKELCILGNVGYRYLKGVMLFVNKLILNVMKSILSGENVFSHFPGYLKTTFCFQYINPRRLIET